MAGRHVGAAVAWRTTAAVIVVLVVTAAVDGLRPVTLTATWFVALAATVGHRRSTASVGGGAGGPATRSPGGSSPARWPPGWPWCPAAWSSPIGAFPVATSSGRCSSLATVPLLVGGAVVDAIRDVPSRYHGVSHRVVEWAVLTGGIVVVYTGIVAGLGSLVGGSGPTWFLVATTGAIALALEPGRRHVRQLVDRLVYGARDDPLAVVQRVVDHLGADSGDHLLPNLVESLRRELRLDAVAFDLRVHDGWQRVAETGPATTHRRVVMLHHRDDVVGRIVVGWEDGPSLRDGTSRCSTSSSAR